MADILYLVERLEQVLAQGWRVPFTTNAVIDEDAFIDVIEQMHIAIPNEIREAQKIVQQRERYLAQAREEAERVIEQAHQRSEEMVSQTDVAARAEERAEYILSEARKEAETIRDGADSYATEVLTRIREALNAYLLQVDNGLAQLQPIGGSAEEADDELLTFELDDELDDLEGLEEEERS